MRVQFDLSGVLPKIADMKQKAMIAATNQANIDITPYVPMDIGTLSNTAVVEPERGHIEWVTPYARVLYNGTRKGRALNISRSKHAKATAKWTQVAKKAHIEKWRRIAEKGMGGK